MRPRMLPAGKSKEFHEGSCGLFLLLQAIVDERQGVCPTFFRPPLRMPLDHATNNSIMMLYDTTSISSDIAAARQRRISAFLSIGFGCSGCCNGGGAGVLDEHFAI